MQGRPQREVRVTIGGNVHGQVVAGDHIVAHMAVPVPDSDQRADLLAAHRVVVTTDVQRSSLRNNVEQRHMRRALEECVRAGIAALGIPQEIFETFDRGDGLVVVMPDTVTLVDVLDTFVEAVAGALREHNQAASDAYRIDLRVAVHAGYVDRVGSEWSGTPLVHAARLVDAVEVKRALGEASGACLALVVSDAVKQVIDEGYCRVGSSGYRHTTVAVKETLCNGWCRLL